MSQTSESEKGKPTPPRNFFPLFPGGCLGLVIIVVSLLAFFISLIFGQRENWFFAAAGYGLILLLAALGGSAMRLLAWTFTAFIFVPAAGAFFLGKGCSYDRHDVSVYPFDGKEQRLALSGRIGWDFEPSDTLQVWSRAPVQMEFFIPPKQAYHDSLYHSDSFNDYMDFFSNSFIFSQRLRTWAAEHGSNSSAVKIKKKIEKVGKAEVPALRYTFPATGIGRGYNTFSALSFAFYKAIDSVRITTHPDSLLATAHLRGGKVYDVYVARFGFWLFGLALAIVGVLAGIMAFKTQEDDFYVLEGSTVSGADKGTKKTKEEPEVVEAEELTEEETRKYSSSKSHDNVFHMGPENKKTGENMDLEQIINTLNQQPEKLDVNALTSLFQGVSQRIKIRQDTKTLDKTNELLKKILVNIDTKVEIADKFGQAQLMSLKTKVEKSKLEVEDLKLEQEKEQIKTGGVTRKDQCNFIVVKYHKDLTEAVLESVKPYLEMEGLQAHYQTLLDKTSDTLDYIKRLIEETNISPQELEDIILRIISGHKKSAADKKAEATQEAADKRQALRDVLLQELRKLRDKQADLEQRQFSVEQKLKDNPNDIDSKKELRIINDELEAVQDEILKMKQKLKSI